jgi:hypothetical protein
VLVIDLLLAENFYLPFMKPTQRAYLQQRKRGKRKKRYKNHNCQQYMCQQKKMLTVQVLTGAFSQQALKNKRLVRYLNI